PRHNIAKRIYTIVNEETLPPRHINTTSHPEIRAVVMRALEKETDKRYQNCREMLEDLKNYRSISPAGGNPQSTMVMGGGSPAATMISGNTAGRGYGNEDQTVITTARSLNARASGP